MKRLAREERFDGHGTAMDLAFFYREIDGPAALVAEDDVELGADRLFKQPWKVETRTGRSAGAAFWRLSRLSNVFDSFIGTVGAHVKLVLALCRRAHETVLGPIELDFLAPHELVKV